MTGRVEDEVVVVPAPEDQLLVIAADALTDRVERREVERRAEHRRDVPVGISVGVDRGEVVGVDLQQVVVDRPGTLTREVPVASGWSD